MGWTLSSKEVEKLLQQSEANECHSEGSRNLWNQGDHHDDHGSLMSHEDELSAQAGKPGISNSLPDHDDMCDMAAWMFKFAGLKVEIQSKPLEYANPSTDTEKCDGWYCAREAPQHSFLRNAVCSKSISYIHMCTRLNEFRDESNAAYKQEEPNRRAETNSSFPIFLG